MSAKKWSIHYGTNPVIRVGGSANALRKMDSALGSQSRGRTALAGGFWAKNQQFSRNIAWDLSLGAFVRRASRMELESFLNDQRVDLFGRLKQEPHDLFIGNPTDDLEWVALENSAPDTESLTPIIIGDVGSVTANVVLGDLSMWSDFDPKYGTRSLYNPDNTASYQHQVPGTATHSDWTSENNFLFMGWIRSTGTSATQNLFRKVNQAILAFGSGQLSFTYAGTTGTFSPNFTMGANRWLFIAIRKPTGTTAELYYGYEWETSLNGPFTATVGTAPGSGGSNALYIGNNSGNGSFIGYLGPMVFADEVLTGANIESEFDLTKPGQVAFTDPGSWNSTYGATNPSKKLYLQMQRLRSFEAITNLMLTKVYNTFAGNATPSDGAIVLDHGLYATTDLGSVFAGSLPGLGDRILFGWIDTYTDAINFCDEVEIVYVTAKNVAPADSYQTRRVTIKPLGLATDPTEGFRASYNNGQAIFRKPAQRWPRAVCLEVTPEEVDSLARGKLREVTYSFGIDSPPFLDNTEQNFSNTLDLHYQHYAP